MKMIKKAPGALRAAKEPATHGLRTKGRSERVVTNVLGAAAKELARGGYAALRVEDVARAAGVNKTTIYRRWPTKAALVRATIRTMAVHRLGEPDTGSLERDLLELLRRAVRWRATMEVASILRVLVLESADPEVERIARGLREEGFEPWLAIVARAKARGEIPAHADARLLIEMVVAPAMVRLHRWHESVDTATLTSIVRVVIAGVRATTVS